MAVLQRELQAGGGQAPLIERVELPQSEDLRRLQVYTFEVLRRRKWRLVVATTAGAAQLVSQTKLSVPMIFRSAPNPVKNCLILNLRHPQSNATGYTSATESEGKMVEALQIAFPDLQQLVMLIDGRPEIDNDDCPPPRAMPPCHSGFVDNTEERDALLINATSLASWYRAARSPLRPIRVLRLCELTDIDQLQQWLPANHGPRPTLGLVVPYHQLFYETGPALIAKARSLRLPAIYGSRNFLPMGALMAMSPLREPPGEARGVELAGRILAGESPANIPVQRPEGVELIMNITVARELGMQPSKAVLRAADRLIR